MQSCCRSGDRVLTPRVCVGVQERGSAIADRGLRNADRGSRREDRASRIEDRVLRVGHDYRLPAPSARHIVHALRMRAGDALALFDGTGGEYECSLVRIERDDVLVRIETHVAVERESACPVVLAQAIIANDMMDLVVRKAVELGVAAISPFYAARSQRAPRERATA